MDHVVPEDHHVVPEDNHVVPEDHHVGLAVSPRRCRFLALLMTSLAVLLMPVVECRFM